MTEKILVNLNGLADLAVANLSASNQLGDAWRAGAGEAETMDVPSTAFGKAAGSDMLSSAYTKVYKAGTSAFSEVFPGVYESDAALLYQTGAAFDAADGQAGGDLAAVAPGQGISGAPSMTESHGLAREFVKEDQKVAKQFRD